MELEIRPAPALRTRVSPGLRDVMRWVFLGVLVGGVWGHAQTWTLLGLVALPLAYSRTRSRWSAFALMLGYYLCAARGLPAGAAVFFGDASPALGWLFWVGSSLLLAAPFALLRFEAPHWRAVGFAAALVLVAVPPLGLIGWCNPITVAGLLFPNSGFAGMVTALVLMVFLIRMATCTELAVWFFIIALMSGAFSVAKGYGVFAPPARWLGVDTSFHALRSGVEVGGKDVAGQLDAFRRMAWFQEFAGGVPDGTITLLPETLLGRMNPVVEFSLPADALRARSAAAFVGAEVPQADGRYVNALVGVGPGLDGVQLAQSVPVLVSMWKPFTGTGAVADLLGRDGVRQVGEQRIGALICYEQLLPWVMGLRGAAAPSVILAAKNVWWARGTSIPAIQQQSVDAFARLFGWRVVSATNT